MKHLAVVGVLTFALVAAVASPVQAAVQLYEADLVAVNNSTVYGKALLLLQDSTLTVQISAFNLEQGVRHPMHIHSPAVGVARLPVLTDDTDNDGLIELDEGLPAYGPVVLPLVQQPGGLFAMAPGGVLLFQETYDLTDAGVFAPGFGSGDLLPLLGNEIVIHGMTVSAAYGAGTPGEVDGTAGYKTVLPVAAGVIQQCIVPEPATLGFLVLGSVAIVLRRRYAA